MSQGQSPSPTPSEPKPSGPRQKRPEKVVLRSYPKVLLLYPTWFMSILGGILSAWPSMNTTVGLWFLLIFGLNLIVLSFEFPRTTSLTLVFFVVAVIFGALWINYKYYPFLPFLSDLVAKLEPSANAQFYWLFAGILGLIYLFVFIDTRFDYWEMMPNEIIHHLGILGNVNRFPAPQLKMEKEITDVFEFMLLGSGRLLLHPSSERRAIVLDNVPNINRRERDIQGLLGVLDVHVHTSIESGDDDS